MRAKGQTLHDCWEHGIDRQRGGDLQVPLRATWSYGAVLLVSAMYNSGPQSDGDLWLV